MTTFFKKIVNVYVKINCNLHIKFISQIFYYIPTPYIVNEKMDKIEVT